MSSSSPLHAPNITLLANAWTDIELTAEQSELRLRLAIDEPVSEDISGYPGALTALAHSVLRVRALEIELGALTGVEIYAEEIQAFDASFEQCLLDVVRMYTGALYLRSAYIESCGSIMLTGTVEDSYVARCDEPIKLNDTVIWGSTIVGELDGQAKRVHDSVLGSSRVDVRLISLTALCGTTEFVAHAVACVRCAPRAPEHFCAAHLSDRGDYCPGLCETACPKEGFENRGPDRILERPEFSEFNGGYDWRNRICDV